MTRIDVKDWGIYRINSKNFTVFVTVFLFLLYHLIQLIKWLLFNS